MERLKALWARVQQLKPMRANQRYNEVRGNLLSAGIAYYAFFSVFPAIAIGGVVFGFVLRDNPDLLASVGDALNKALPNFVKTANNPGGLIELNAPSVSFLTISGVVAVVSLVLSGIGWISSFRDGLSAAFGAIGSPGNVVTAKLRDLATFVVFGLSFLISAVLTSVLGSATGWISEHLGLGTNTLLVTAAGLFVGFLIDAGVLLLMMRFLAGLHLPYRTVLQGSLVGALGLSVVKYFGLQLIGNATKSPLLGSVALVIGLLFWLNLIARLVLLAACWASLDVDPAIIEAENAKNAPASTDAAKESDVERTAGDRPTVEVPGAIPVGPRPAAIGPAPTRERDRTSLAAGAVIGTVAGLVAGPVLRAARARSRSSRG